MHMTKNKKIIRKINAFLLFLGGAVLSSAFAGKSTLTVNIKNDIVGHTVYMVIPVQNANGKGPAFLKFDKNNTPYYSYSADSNQYQPSNFYAIGKVLKYGDNIMEFPSGDSARIYFSLDKKLQIGINQGGAMVLPAAQNANDKNYNTVFDKVEYTLGSNIYINPTAVDFVGLPISLQFANTSEKISGFQVNRTTLMQTLTERLTAAGEYLSHIDPTKRAWPKLIIYNKDKNVPNGILRVLSPGKSTAFQDTYPNTSIEQVYQYYVDKGYHFLLDMGELYQDDPQDETGKELKEILKSAKLAKNIDGTIVKKGDSYQYVFTLQDGSPLMTIDAPDSAIQYFSAGTFNYSPPSGKANNNGYQTLMATMTRQLDVAFELSRLAEKNDYTVINKTYFEQFIQPGGGVYTNNPVLTMLSSDSIYYDLYSRTIHENIKGGDAIYSFPYDEPTGRDGGLNQPIANNKLTIRLLPLSGTPTPSCKPISVQGTISGQERNNHLSFNVMQPSENVTGYELFDKSKAKLATESCSSAQCQLTDPSVLDHSDLDRVYHYFVRSVCSDPDVESKELIPVSVKLGDTPSVHHYSVEIATGGTEFKVKTKDQLINLPIHSHQVLQLVDSDILIDTQSAKQTKVSDLKEGYGVDGIYIIKKTQID